MRAPVRRASAAEARGAPRGPRPGAAEAGRAPGRCGQQDGRHRQPLPLPAAAAPGSSAFRAEVRAPVMMAWAVAGGDVDGTPLDSLQAGARKRVQWVSRSLLPGFTAVSILPTTRFPLRALARLCADPHSPPAPRGLPFRVCAEPLLRLSWRGHCGPCLPFPARESRTPPHALPQADTAAAPCPARVLCTRPSTRCSHVIFSTNPSSLSDR